MIAVSGVLFVILVFLPAFRSGAARVLFRAWIPAWRFFDQAGTELPPRRILHRLRWRDFFWNPEGNLVHLDESLSSLGERE